ncbi:MAG: endonuclease [Alphaproteobacteria bacterium]
MAFTKNELIDIKTMVEWHEKYPPSEPEKKREAEIFKVQKNHNPYITQSASYMREVWLG